MSLPERPAFDSLICKGVEHGRTISVPIPVAPAQSEASAAEEEEFAVALANATAAEETSRRLSDGCYEQEIVRRDYGFVTIAFDPPPAAATRADAATLHLAKPASVLLVIAAAAVVAKGIVKQGRRFVI